MALCYDKGIGVASDSHTAQRLRSEASHPPPVILLLLLLLLYFPTYLFSDVAVLCSVRESVHAVMLQPDAAHSAQWQQCNATNII
jgi:hypothetical protein